MSGPPKAESHADPAQARRALGVALGDIQTRLPPGYEQVGKLVACKVCRYAAPSADEVVHDRYCGMDHR